MNKLYKLTIKEKSRYKDEQEYMFDDFNDMVTFAEVALKKAAVPMEVIISLTEKEGDQNESV
jgi:hypothetical protein